MSDTESFEQAMAEMADKVASPYWIGMADRLKRAHDREIRDTAQQQYHRGYTDGRHSMDAEHAAVAMRLRGLCFDGGSHENLSNIAKAIWYADWCWGWTQGACMGLRDELVRLMGGVSDDIYKNGDSLKTGDGDDTCDSQCGGACAAGDGRDSVEQTEVSDGRTANDCGGDSRGSYRGVSVHMDGLGDEPTLSDLWGAWKDGEGRITDELRKWASDRHCKGISHTDALNIGLIADHIDEQFDRICKQQEAVLQSTIDGMVGDRESDQLRIEKLVEQRDAARARTDELSDELLRTRRERDELQRELRETKLELESLRARIAEDANDHAAWQIKIQELKAKLDALDAIRDAIDG